MKSDENSKGDKIGNQDLSNKHCIHLVTLSNPLIVKNYLPITVSLMIESGGATRSMLLSEVGSLLKDFHVLVMYFIFSYDLIS